jgi:Kef-type K+ transport system membrane component KefB
VVLLWIVAPVVRRATDRLELHPFGRAQLAIVLMGMLASAATTELIGVHGFFGAFLLGAIVPHRSRLTREIRERLHDIVAVLFLPVFFAYSGLRTHIDLLVDERSWILCGLITATACLGKFGGSFVASRLSGLSWMDSTAMGVLMNTRGLVELIVLNLGLDMQLISPTLFTMLVVMALATTFMTTPILTLILHNSQITIYNPHSAIQSAIPNPQSSIRTHPTVR